MKRVALITVIILGFLIAWNNFYPKCLIAGTYVSNNPRPILEGPSSIDTLILMKDGTFKNRTWRQGWYKVSGNEIQFIIDYPHGEMNYHSFLSRPYYLGRPKILLNGDLGYFYFKVQ